MDKAEAAVAVRKDEKVEAPITTDDVVGVTDAVEAAEEDAHEELTDESTVQDEADTTDVDNAQDRPRDILKNDDEGYKETDVFAWANNLVQFKDELKIDLYFFNKNNVVYRTNVTEDLKKQLEPLFIDDLLEFVLEGADNGLIVRGFEQAEGEDNVLQRTRLSKVEKAAEVLNWLKTQEHEIELFNEEEHDIKRVKGIIARVSHQQMPKTFYVIKALPQSQVMKGSAGWMIRDNKFIKFDADAALRVPADNQLLVLEQDMYVFSQAKLKSLFGYDAKEASIAEKKVEEIQQNYKLSFGEGDSMNSLLKGKKSLIKKLQKIETDQITQDDLLSHGEEIGVELMTDDNGAIIIMDSKDLEKFVNLLNDDYIESPLTGIRYEIQKKRELKLSEEDGPIPASPFES
ncbi:MAG TPA: Kiwa anti-phage protein KwaB-like domain-containing protein [Candidatus Limnocylindrales bacterium]|nr:Kiwa anti-phage protein KwaB-like domain-containing protein [Candidatus Limnocylindrales bacterium]